MGYIDGIINVSCLVISSYVTTLQSLFLTQQKYAPLSKGQQKLLSFSQPRTPGQHALTQTNQEVNKVVQMFCLSNWPIEDIICLHRSEATVDTVSSALNSCLWVHLVCHNFQGPKLGMKSEFALHDSPLKLSEITSKSPPNVQFAFLSACQGASG